VGRNTKTVEENGAREREQKKRRRLDRSLIGGEEKKAPKKGKGGRANTAFPRGRRWPDEIGFFEGWAMGGKEKRGGGANAGREKTEWRGHPERPHKGIGIIGRSDCRGPQEEKKRGKMP